MATIQEFKSALGSGARANTFETVINYPASISNLSGVNNAQSHLLIKGAQLPGSTMGQTEVPFRGRAIRLPGDKVYQELSLTILNDIGLRHRKALDNWHNVMNDAIENTNEEDLSLIYGGVRVTQLNRKGERIRTYNFVDVFPLDVGAVDLSLDTNDTIEEYTVSFAVNHWTVDDLVSGADALIPDLSIL